jgi:hypothetical protein
MDAIKCVSVFASHSNTSVSIVIFIRLILMILQYKLRLFSYINIPITAQS